MLFYPKNFKFKKLQKGKSFNKINTNILINNKNSHSIKLIALKAKRITSKQLVAIKFLIRKSIKKCGFLKFNIFPQKSITKKPSEIRMGKGKGTVNHWVSNVKYGIIICEIFFKKKFKLKILKALKQAKIRLPLKTKITK